MEEDTAKKIETLTNQVAELLAKVTELERRTAKVESRYHEESVSLDGINAIYRKAIKGEK